jgi:peptidoglycan/LPS O-acetylase OafA/YrhL
MTNPNRFVLLDGMRGFAALAVLSFHAVVVTEYQYLDSFYLFVDFFFVLSGFVLYPSIPKSFVGFGRTSLKFVLNRILRFWPMLIAVVALIWVLYRIGQSTQYATPDPNYSDQTFIQAFFLTQLFNAGAIGMNWALWSLSAEWFGNLTYIPLAAVKRNIGIGIGIVLGYAAIWYGLNNDQAFIGDSWSVGSGPIAHWEAYGRMMAEFGFGLLIRKYLPQLAQFRNLKFLVLSIVFVAALLWSHSYFQGDMVYWTVYFAGPVFALLVLQASAYNPSAESWVGSTLSWLGKMSFGIYAFHVVILITYDQIVPQPDAFPNFGSSVWTAFLLTKIIVCSLIAIVLAYQTNRLVEGPIQRLGKRALERL